MVKDFGYAATADGKYLLINPEETKTIYLYQVYQEGR
jgi:hypothetical protein